MKDSQTALVNLDQPDELIEHRCRIALHLRLLRFNRNRRAVAYDNTRPLNIADFYA